jgi:CheY-like chemotaxis protein
MHSILIIDDEPDVRDSMRRVLERAGFAVRTADSVAMALDEMRQLVSDVVITDIIMPKVSGVLAVESIRRDFPGVRIVAISGGGNFGITEYKPNAITTTAYLAAAERAGAHFLLTKPFESQDLIRAVESVLGMGHA